MRTKTSLLLKGPLFPSHLYATFTIIFMIEFWIFASLCSANNSVKDALQKSTAFQERIDLWPFWAHVRLQDKHRADLNDQMWRLLQWKMRFYQPNGEIGLVDSGKSVQCKLTLWKGRRIIHTGTFPVPLLQLSWTCILNINPNRCKQRTVTGIGQSRNRMCAKYRTFHILGFCWTQS